MADIDKLVTDAREAGMGVDDRHVAGGAGAIRLTGDPGGTDVDYYEIGEDGKITHYGPNGQNLGTVSDKDVRKAIGLD